MLRQPLFRNNSFVFVALVLLSYAVSILIFIVLDPTPFANIIGWLSLSLYTSTIMPSIMKTVFPATKKQPILKWLFQNRRYTGVAAFCLAWSHGILMIWQINLNLLDFKTYIHYFQAFSSIIILTILAITSNDFSVKRLKQNWKKLHKLTYLLIFLFPWHILDKMNAHWTHITPLAVLITMINLILFLQRKSIEQIQAQGKQESST